MPKKPQKHAHFTEDLPQPSKYEPASFKGEAADCEPGSSGVKSLLRIPKLGRLLRKKKKDVFGDEPSEGGESRTNEPYGSKAHADDDPYGLRDIVIDIGPLHRAESNPKSAVSKGREQVKLLTQRTLQAAVNVNDETIEALKRSERVIYDAEDEGREAATEMTSQRDKVEAIDHMLDTMPALMTRAKKEMVGFARQLLRDKVFLFLCGFVAVALIMVAVIVTQKYMGGGGKEEEPQPTVPSYTKPPS